MTTPADASASPESAQRLDAGRLVAVAMSRAFALGQVYWHQADSESIAQNRKADETFAQFSALVTETLAALPDAPALVADRVDPTACPACVGMGTDNGGSVCAKCEGTGDSPLPPHAPAPSEDAITLAFRLYGEDPDTFAPETRAVMDRLRPIVTARLQNPLGDPT